MVCQPTGRDGAAATEAEEAASGLELGHGKLEQLGQWRLGGHDDLGRGDHAHNPCAAQALARDFWHFYLVTGAAQVTKTRVET